MNTPLTTEDYLRELVEQSRPAEFAALVIAFEDQTRFIWRNSADGASRLEALLGTGGKPLAILGANIRGNAVVYWVRPFPPYAEDAEVRRYLEVVGDEVMETFKHRWEAARN